jgi:hypothetical protein
MLVEKKRAQRPPILAPLKHAAAVQLQNEIEELETHPVSQALSRQFPGPQAGGLGPSPESD